MMFHVQAPVNCVQQESFQPQLEQLRQLLACFVWQAKYLLQAKVHVHRAKQERLVHS